MSKATKYEYYLSDESKETLQLRNSECGQTQPESMGKQHQVSGGQMASSKSDIPQIVKSRTYNKMVGVYKPEAVLYRNDGNAHIKSKGTRC